MVTDLTISLEVEVQGRLEPAEPQDGARVLNFKVFMLKPNGRLAPRRLEITDYLTDVDHQDLYHQFLEILEAKNDSQREFEASN